MPKGLARDISSTVANYMNDSVSLQMIIPLEQNMFPSMNENLTEFSLPSQTIAKR